jgi:hypothetical protein
MEGFVPSGYVMLEQAVDEVGRHLMAEQWRGQETILLKRDPRATEPLAAVGGAATATDTALGRLNRAVNHLTAALFASDLRAIVLAEDGTIRDCPPSFWIKPEMRSAFRSGELPTGLRVALKGHKADIGKCRVLVLESDLRRLVRRLKSTRGRPDVEIQFRSWLARKVDEVAAMSPPQKKRLWVEAQSVFKSELPFRSFERIWAATVPATWRRSKGARQAKAAR